MHPKNPNATLRLLFFLLSLILISDSARAQSNLVSLISSSNDFVGEGQIYATTNVANYTIYCGSTEIQVFVAGYIIQIESPSQQTLTVGTYTNAALLSSNGVPGLDVYENGRGCDAVCGSFQILEYQLDTYGNISHLWMTFSQFCECSSNVLTGDIRYNSLLAPPLPLPRILAVPSSYPTIQSAIDAASLIVADTVMVSPGTYNEFINFGGKNISVISSGGADVTFINPPSSNNAVTFAASENTNAVLAGFTITNADDGIYISSASPTVVSNVLTSCFIGIECYYSSSFIINNTISNSGFESIHLYGYGSALVQGNNIISNETGIVLEDGGSPLIINNFVQGSYEDGINASDFSSPNIVQNVIADNFNSGLNLFYYSYQGPIAVNNTIVGNGTGIIINGETGDAQLFNNIVVGNPALSFDFGGSPSSPIIENNDFYSATSNSIVRAPSNFLGINGNISVNPFFVCDPGGDYRLLSGSPCIDAGTNTAPSLPDFDFEGGLRILSGTNGSPIIDMGAYEFNAALPAPMECLFLDCPTDITALASNQNPVAVYLTAPQASPGATVVFLPPSGSLFAAGTNSVLCTVSLGTNSTSCSFNVVIIAPPVITVQPQFITVAAGHPTAFSVEVGGQIPATYQWYMGDNILYGQNSFTLSFPDPQESDSGVYYVVVANAAGSLKSAPVELQVIPSAPIITTNPVSFEAGAGSNVTLTVTAIGTEPFSYQWLFNGIQIKGATSSSFSFTATSAQMAGNYEVVVTNATGRVISAPARVTIFAEAPYFISEPQSITQTLDSSVSFSAQASGSLPIRYQWYFKNHPLPGRTTANLTLRHITVASAGTYYVVAINGRGRAASDPAELYVEIPLRLTRPFTNKVATIGSTVTLSTSVTGTPPFTFAWQFNGSAISCTTSNLIITNVSLADEGYYQVTISDQDSTNYPFPILSYSAKLSIIGFDEKLAAWGDDAENQTKVPPDLANVIAVAGGNFHSLALRANGSLVAWGNNADGQVSIPKHLRSIVSIACGAEHNLALDENGSVHAWGNNYYGQCDVPDLDQPIAVAAGNAHSLALLSSGMIVGWGDDSYHQLDIPVIITPIPSEHTGISIRSIAAGQNHNLALLTDGIVVGWGDDSAGQIDTPMNLNNVMAISAGALHSVALCSNGTVVAWGDDTLGQTDVPVGLSNVVAIAAGGDHTLCFLS